MKKMAKVNLNILMFIISMLCFISPAQAQETGTVTIIKDPKIDVLIARRLKLEREAIGTSRITAEGYRVQLFSGSNRAQTYDEQARFKALYPSLNTYISYSQPNYKIRAGDFRTRLEAEKFMSQARRAYSSLFILPERINLSR